MIVGQYYTCRFPISFYNMASVYNVGPTYNINHQRFKLQFCHWKPFLLGYLNFNFVIYTSYVYLLDPLTSWIVFTLRGCSNTLIRYVGGSQTPPHPINTKFTLCFKHGLYSIIHHARPPPSQGCINVFEQPLSHSALRVLSSPMLWMAVCSTLPPSLCL